MPLVWEQANNDDNGPYITAYLKIEKAVVDIVFISFVKFGI